MIRNHTGTHHGHSRHTEIANFTSGRTGFTGGHTGGHRGFTGELHR